jgi:hypothetical protein
MNMKAKIRFDAYNDLWVDVTGCDMHDLQRACLMGGNLLVYHLVNDEYRIGFTYTEGRVTVQFLGCAITEEQFNTQMKLWDNESCKKVAPGTELLLLDNQYFI